MGDGMSQGVEGQYAARRERVDRARASGDSKMVRHKDAALEGLRALAIIGIVLYHMRPSILQGGFLGVTVFFVLTGFLITRSILRALANGTFLYGAYLLKRFKRLVVPALSIITLTAVAIYLWILITRSILRALANGTFLYGAYLLKRFKRLVVPALSIITLTAVAIYLWSPSLLPKVQADALPGALFYENWVNIFRKVSYFEAAGLPSPLTPLWFLGVTMQFYIVWPVLVAILAVFTQRARRSSKLNVLMYATFALALLSTVLMAVLYHNGEGTTRVYYGTDTRAAELLTGAIAAMALEWFHMRQRPARVSASDGRARSATPAHAAYAPRMRAGWSPAVVNGVSVVCLLIVCIAAWCANGENAFLYRGGYWLFAAVVALLIVLVQHPACVMRRVLAWKPLVYVGGRSFSIYLVHYPIILIMNPATRTQALAWWEPIVQLMVVLVVGELFYRVIEAPTIRFGLVSRITCAVMAICVAVLAFAPLPWQQISTARAQRLRPETAVTATCN